MPACAEEIVHWTLLARRLATGEYRYDEDGVLEKRCSHCQEYWPADSEFFYRNKSDGDGLHCMCISCNVESLHKSRAAKANLHQEPLHV